MMLLLHHPDIAALTCEECLQWMYDFRGRRFSLAGGQRVKRPHGVKPLCALCPKCGGHEREASPDVGRKVELTVKNQQALRAYYEQQDGDALTRRVFGIIRRVMDSHGRHVQRSILDLLAMR